MLVGWVGLSGAVTPRLARAQEAVVESPGRGASAVWQVRVVWLVDGLADDAARVPPRGLDAPLQALASLGITNLTMAAQWVVLAVDNEEFAVAGSAKVHEPCGLKIKGLLVSQAGTDAVGQATEAVRLEFTMVAEAGDGDAARSLCELRTTALAPIGHPVLLGVTPVQSQPTVVLLEVTPGAARVGPARPR